MKVALLTLHLQIPDSNSLKEKRSRLKPLLIRLHKEFNVSAAEVDYHDRWHDTLIGCALVSNSSGVAQRALQQVAKWLDRNWPDVTLIDEQIEIIQ